MTQYNYICWSRTGVIQEGEGSTDMELGSEKQTIDLLHKIAMNVQQDALPWDPFNIKLHVRAHTEPQPKFKFYV